MHARSPAVPQLLTLAAMQHQHHVQHLHRVQSQHQHHVQHQQLAAVMQLQLQLAAVTQLLRQLVQRFLLVCWPSASPARLLARLQQRAAAAMQLQLQQLQAAVATKRLRCEWNSRHKDMIEEAVIEGRPLFFRLDGNLRKPFPLLVYIYTHDL
jgi:hypothetical protein